MTLSSPNFLGLNVPDCLIARYPLTKRDSSKLFVTNIDHHTHFESLDKFISSGDLLIINDTKVQPCRLIGKKERTSGRVELLFTSKTSEYCGWAIYKASHRLKQGAKIIIGPYVLEVLECQGRQVHLRSTCTLQRIFDHQGHVPLPSYMNRSSDFADKQRYQSVWATQSGSCAAPTASLHFTKHVLDKVRAKGVEIQTCTLHVGLGTFLPVKGSVQDHVMHEESYEVSKNLINKILEVKKRGGKVIAVGTSVTRALETAIEKNLLGQYKLKGKTSLFIKPGYRFKVVDRLITNFHQPDSTLILLVQAFAGVQKIKEYYSQAFMRQYRLYSYGDAMLLENKSC